MGPTLATAVDYDVAFLAKELVTFSAKQSGLASLFDWAFFTIHIYLI
jgi:hypothetical protein